MGYEKPELEIIDLSFNCVVVTSGEDYIEGETNVPSIDGFN